MLTNHLLMSIDTPLAHLHVDWQTAHVDQHKKIQRTKFFMSTDQLQVSTDRLHMLTNIRKYRGQNFSCWLINYKYRLTECSCQPTDYSCRLIRFWHIFMSTDRLLMSTNIGKYRRQNSLCRSMNCKYRPIQENIEAKIVHVDWPSTSVDW